MTDADSRGWIDPDESAASNAASPDDDALPSAQIHQPLFVGRADLFAFVRGRVARGERNGAALLIGSPRIGKTAFLRVLSAGYDSRVLGAYVDGTGLSAADFDALIYRLAEAGREALNRAGLVIDYLPDPPNALVSDALSSGRAYFRGPFLNALLGMLRNGRRMIFLIDHAETLVQSMTDADGSEAIREFQALLQVDSRIDVLFAIRTDAEQFTASNPLFHDPLMIRRLTLLDELEAETFLERALPDSIPDVRELLLSACGGHPYFLAIGAAALSAQASVTDVVNAIPDLLQAASGTLTPIVARASVEGQAALIALAQLNKQTNAPQTAEQLIAWIMGNLEFAPDQTSIAAGLRDAAYNDVVRNVEGGAYQFTTGLASEWIARRGTKISYPVVEQPLAAQPRRFNLLTLAGLLAFALIGGVLLFLLFATLIPGAAGGTPIPTSTLSQDLDATRNALALAQTETARPTATLTASATFTPSETLTPTYTSTSTFTLTNTASATATASITSIPPSQTIANTIPATVFNKITESPDTPTLIRVTQVPVVVPSGTVARTATSVPSRTSLASATPTFTPSFTAMSTRTVTSTQTATFTPTYTTTFTYTFTSTYTLTSTATYTPSRTATNRPTITQTPSRTSSATRTSIPAPNFPTTQFQIQATTVP